MEAAAAECAFDAGSNLIEEAGSDGLRLLELMRERVGEANGRDKALVTTNYDNHVAPPTRAEGGRPIALVPGRSLSPSMRMRGHHVSLWLA